MVALVDAEPRDFAAHVQEVQQELANSTRRAGLAPDPYARVVEAQSAALGVLPAFVEEISRAREPWTYDERRAVVKEAVKELRQEAKAFVAAEQQRRTLIAAVGAAVLRVGVGAGGYWWGHSNSAAEVVHLEADIHKALSRDDAALWLTLIENNPPVAQAKQGCWEDDGHHACTFGIWIEPEPSAALRQAEAAVSQQTTKPTGKH